MSLLPANSSNSYAQILKSSSLIGGAQSVNLIFGMVRVKFAAIIIGPVGVGLIGIYQAIQSALSTIAGLGMQTSAVREIALAVSEGDDEQVGRTICALRRIVWATGLAGALITGAFAGVISRYTFDSDEYVLEVSLIGLVILVSNIQKGQSALLQGMRRIGDLAKLSIVSAVLGTCVAVSLYALFGLQGIVPALLAVALIQLIATTYFARRVRFRNVRMGLSETIQAGGGMIKLGLSFMWTGVLVAIVSYLTRVFIIQDIDLNAAGIFAAAYALSGMFVSFVLRAMGADYLPRLTAAKHDQRAMNQLVNEQTEVGLLLAVPGLLATLTMAPWIIRIFYTSEFHAAADLLQWFILGCLGRVISWPMGFIMIALGRTLLYAIIQTLMNIVHITLIWIGLKYYGLEGVAVAFFLLYVFSSTFNAIFYRQLTGFVWSSETRRLLLVLVPVVTIAFATGRTWPVSLATGIGIFLTGFSILYTVFEGIVERVGHDHVLVKKLTRAPGIAWLVNVRGAQVGRG